MVKKRKGENFMRKLFSKKWGILLAVLILVLSLLLLVSGCSSGEETVGNGTEQEEQAGSADSDVIPFGVLVPYTGELGAYGEIWFEAMKMATEEMNELGGPLGKQIKLFTEDTETSVEQGIRAARKLINANGVIAINGPESTTVTAIMDFAEENEVVVASEASGTTKLNNIGGKYQFRTCPSDDFDGIAAAKILWDQGFKKIAIMHTNDEGRTSIANAVEKEFKGLGGEVVAIIPYTPRQTSYQAELSKAFSNNPDVLYLGAGQESGPTVVKEWHERGYGGQLMVASDMTVPEIFDLIDPEILEGTLSEVPRAEESSPEFQRFKQMWLDSYGELAGGFESNAYDGQIILGLAIEAAGEATGKGIAENYQKVANPPGEIVNTFEEGVKELRAGNDINYEGASGPCDFDEFGNVAGNIAAIKAENGKWVEFDFYPASEFDIE
jgi:ABC-type branched-subunit amino acid transport system substrate-binding protein